MNTNYQQQRLIQEKVKRRVLKEQTELFNLGLLTKEEFEAMQARCAY